MSKASSIVLVTGANGFIASSIVQSFLEAGYTVRGTIRSQEKAEAWKKSFSSHSAQLQVAIVPDISVDGAFDEAVIGVDYVVHGASPLAKLDGSADNEKDTLLPAINGTLIALRSAVKEPKVKKVVILSSTGSVVDYTKQSQAGQVYDESSWNPFTFEVAKKAPPMVAYVASKALAEKAAWDFVEKEKPSFKLVSLNPAFVYGPSLAALNPTAPFAGSTNGFIATLVLKPDTDVTKAFGGPYFVDVRDVATAHVLAVENPAADNKRFILAVKQAFPSDYVTWLRKEQWPAGVQLPTVPEGFVNPPAYELKNDASQNVLGLKYTAPEKTIVDTARWVLKVVGKA